MLQRSERSLDQGLHQFWLAWELPRHGWNAIRRGLELSELRNLLAIRVQWQDDQRLGY